MGHWVYSGSSHSHYSDATMSAMASQITGVSIACSAVDSGSHQRKYQRSASLAFCAGNLPVNSPHKGQWRGKCFHLMTSSWCSIVFLLDRTAPRPSVSNGAVSSSSCTTTSVSRYALHQCFSNPCRDEFILGTKIAYVCTFPIYFFLKTEKRR